METSPKNRRVLVLRFFTQGPKYVSSTIRNTHTSLKYFYYLNHIQLDDDCHCRLRITREPVSKVDMGREVQVLPE